MPIKHRVEVEKTKDVWLCDSCGREYSARWLAEDCEKRDTCKHDNFFKIIYDYDDLGISCGECLTAMTSRINHGAMIPASTEYTQAWNALVALLERGEKEYDARSKEG